MPPHVHIDFVIPHPGRDRSVTDLWVWGAHRAQLRCPDDVSYYIYIYIYIYICVCVCVCVGCVCVCVSERGVLGGALNLNSTSYPDHGRYGDLPLQGKIPTAKPGIEPGTAWLIIRGSDHQPQGWSLNWKVWRFKAAFWLNREVTAYRIKLLKKYCCVLFFASLWSSKFYSDVRIKKWSAAIETCWPYEAFANKNRVNPSSTV
jgi:hypothetical protein